MAAVIGFVSLILAIVAIITSVTLGITLQNQLDAQLRAVAATTASWTTQAMRTNPADVDVRTVLDGRRVQCNGMLVAVTAPGNTPSGAVIDTDCSVHALTDKQFQDVLASTSEPQPATATLSGLGSYRLVAQNTPGDAIVVTGLPRDEIQSTMTRLFTVIALATLGGLILLALTTAVTISVGLRPLRAVVATATRVASKQLDRGEVSITERVPEAEADPRTETGLVGAALNTLLDHVDTSLASRQHNEERMRRFVADASHELRTPLASIRGYSELSLRDKGLPENAHTALERIQAQSLRMTRLVEDLLLLARLDEGRELSHAPVDLTMLAVEELTDARPTATDHIWGLDVPEEPIMVDGDAGRLHQVVANLLANARTHTPAGTTITLSLTATADGAELRVHDDGPGIDPEVRDELFARFARGDVSRARQTGGTGLGLAIAKAIVEGHGGTIEVQSAPGDTTFLVRLPAKPHARAETGA
ncbi:HAMP domain-containing histidine kinase [Microbacterium sp. KUDC0406]|nr:HAMP domain-containing histidine kinase [Microbacterium sp. KUDC0406]